MVMPYGGKITSTLKYVAESVEDKLERKELVALFGDDYSKAVTYLANLVHAATRKVVKKAAVVMQWLQDVADVAGKDGVHLSWTTPHGFVAHQHYVQYKTKEVDFVIDGKRLRPTLPSATKKINTQKARNGISPNFVHSLDACAMMMTVNKAKRMGVDSYRMVHDDYGTHAADTAVMAKCLREAFVELYQDNDVLANFLSEVKQQLSVDAQAKLPELPKPGDFDITDVLRSEFFFA
jgi:DNA-directed RNA polymerase